MNSNIVKKVLYALTIMLSVNITYSAASKIREAFDQKYKAWRDYLAAHPEFRLYSEWMPDPERGLLFQEIVNIGLPVIPYAAIKIKEDPKEDRLWRAIREIAKVQIVATVDKVTNKTVLPARAARVSRLL